MEQESFFLHPSELPQALTCLSAFILSAHTVVVVVRS